jgi:hypothetical protein
MKYVLFIVMMLVNTEKAHLLFIMTFIALEIPGLNLHYCRLSKQILNYSDFAGAQFGKSTSEAHLKFKMAKRL